MNRRLERGGLGVDWSWVSSGICCRQLAWLGERLSVRALLCMLLLNWISLLALPAAVASDQGQQALGPSIVSIQDRQLMVRRRAADGSLPALAESFVIRGVVWSPAGRETATTKDDPDNAHVRRGEYALWQSRDIPLLAGMQVNTVRLLIDPGFDPRLGPAGQRLLDDLYANGIMVVMNVDDGINDLQRVERVVEYYKDHPAILMWMLGSEWNINLYFGVADSVLDAARRTEQAAHLIKRLDPHHPVATSYGDIQIEDQGRRLADTREYVETICPSVDVWALNIYRGSSFGNLFAQWAAITDKPMFIGEFGTDAYRSEARGVNPPGAIDDAMQARWNLSLWNDISANLATNHGDGVALGGTLFEWNDEWWKVSPHGSQESGGFELSGGHPDDFANEEYFGLLDIDREPRDVYAVLREAFRAMAEMTDASLRQTPAATTVESDAR
ncbi:MAG: hypothetical protein EOM91_00435 [Sphingobacteriia bacterium]|nr:hypothetical protein [Sphingobacteriia bacterium]NCC39548.1 hypothetical protein [Gammaproteobacteria bacterium]